jgi:hypothetical protein
MAFFNGLPMDTVTAGEGSRRQGCPTTSRRVFDLYSIVRLRGRDFTWSDNDTSPKVAIVNEALARKLSPSGEVVGSRIQITSGQVKSDVEIGGVVADATVSSIRERHVAGIYRPMMQDLRYAQTPMAHVRVIGDAAAVQRHYVEVVNAQGRHFVQGCSTWTTVDNAVVEQRHNAGMAGFAATLAMTLAAVGIWLDCLLSVVARSRNRRAHEHRRTQGDVVRMLFVRPGGRDSRRADRRAARARGGDAVRSQLYGVTNRSVDA